MKFLSVLVSFALWSGSAAHAEQLRLAGVVPLTGEVQVKRDKRGMLVINKKGLNNLKLKNVKKRQIASTGQEVSQVVLEAP